MLDTDGRVATWSLGAERLEGYRAEEILGADVSRFYVPEDIAVGKPRHGLEVAEREGRHEEEAWRVRKDGSRFWADVVTTALRDPAGTLLGYGRVTRDITDRSARPISSDWPSRRRPTGMILMDDRGRIVLVNAQVERLFGYTREEVVGQSIEMLVPERFRARHPEVPRGLLQRPESPGPWAPGRDLFGLRRDGTEVPIEIGLNPLEAPGGRFVLARSSTSRRGSAPSGSATGSWASSGRSTPSSSSGWRRARRSSGRAQGARGPAPGGPPPGQEQPPGDLEPHQHAGAIARRRRRAGTRSTSARRGCRRWRSSTRSSTSRKTTRGCRSRSTRGAWPATSSTRPECPRRRICAGARRRGRRPGRGQGDPLRPHPERAHHERAQARVPGRAVGDDTRRARPGRRRRSFRLAVGDDGVGLPPGFDVQGPAVAGSAARAACWPSSWTRRSRSRATTGRCVPPDDPGGGVGGIRRSARCSSWRTRASSPTTSSRPWPISATTPSPSPPPRTRPWRGPTERRPDVALVDIRIKGRLDGIQTAQLLQERFGVPIVYLTAHADDATLERAQADASLSAISSSRSSPPSCGARSRSRSTVTRRSRARDPTAAAAPAAASSKTRASPRPELRPCAASSSRSSAAPISTPPRRSREFLCFVVEEALAGRGEAITQGHDRHQGLRPEGRLRRHAWTPSCGSRRAGCAVRSSGTTCSRGQGGPGPDRAAQGDLRPRPSAGSGGRGGRRHVAAPEAVAPSALGTPRTRWPSIVGEPASRPRPLLTEGRRRSRPGVERRR